LGKISYKTPYPGVILVVLTRLRLPRTLSIEQVAPFMRGWLPRILRKGKLNLSVKKMSNNSMIFLTTGVLLSCYGTSKPKNSVDAELICLEHFIQHQNDVRVVDVTQKIEFPTSLFLIQRCVKDSILHTTNVASNWRPMPPCPKDFRYNLPNDSIDSKHLQSDTLMATVISVRCAVELEGETFVQIHLAREDSMLGYDVFYKLNSISGPVQVGSIGWVR